MGCHPSHWLSYFSEGLKHQPVLKHSKFSEIITRNNHTSWQSKIVHRVTGFGRIASQMEWWTIAFSWTASTTTSWYIMIYHDISKHIKISQDISWLSSMLGTFCRHTAYSCLHQCHCVTLQVLLTLRNPAVLQNVSFHPCVPAPSCGRAATYVCLVAASLCGVAETFFRIEFYVQKIQELLIFANWCLLGSWLICNCHPRWRA